jgi:uncharacterized membrane protein YraQ (UPF0718 family)
MEKKTEINTVNTTENLTAPKKDIENIISFRKGFSYSFTEGEHTIHLHCSAVNGREQLYIDDKLVSKKWSFRRKSIHQFSIGDDLYEVELNVVNMLTGETHCTLIKNDVHVKTLKKALKKSRQLNKSNFWWYIPGFFVAGVVSGFLAVKVIFMLFGE